MLALTVGGASDSDVGGRADVRAAGVRLDSPVARSGKLRKSINTAYGSFAPALTVGDASDSDVGDARGSADVLAAARDAPAHHEPEAPAQPALPVPDWDALFPKKNKYRDALVAHLLPLLLDLLRDPTNRLTAPTRLVEMSVDACARSGQAFWGQYGVYTRRRSVVDSVLAHYFTELQNYVSGR